MNYKPPIDRSNCCHYTRYSLPKTPLVQYISSNILKFPQYPDQRWPSAAIGYLPIPPPEQCRTNWTMFWSASGSLPQHTRRNGQLWSAFSANASKDPLVHGQQQIHTCDISWSPRCLQLLCTNVGETNGSPARMSLVKKYPITSLVHSTYWLKIT